MRSGQGDRGSIRSLGPRLEAPCRRPDCSRAPRAFPCSAHRMQDIRHPSAPDRERSRVNRGRRKGRTGPMRAALRCRLLGWVFVSLAGLASLRALRPRDRIGSAWKNALMNQSTKYRCFVDGCCGEGMTTFSPSPACVEGASRILYSSLTSTGDNDWNSRQLAGRRLEFKWSMPPHLVDDDPVQLRHGEVTT